MDLKAIRIYQAGTRQHGDCFDLSSEASHHVAVVLRMQQGDSLTVFNGDNTEYDVNIHSVHKRAVSVCVCDVRPVNKESGLHIHLGQAISKGDRMEWVMQKAVELGVASITPVITERCVMKLDAERMLKKIQQWQAIVISACEQCGRNTVPKVQVTVKLVDYLNTARAESKLILHPQNSKTWRDYSFKQDINLLIGPEGGFSDTELELAQTNGFNLLSLGPRILRTETAAICALSVLQAVAGDL